MHYAGLDIHKEFTVGVIKTKDGELLKQDKFRNTEEEIKEFFEGFPSNDTEVVMESCCVWEHIYEKINSMGYKVKLANPLKTKAIAFARIKTDKIDASTLTDLLRANLVAESYIPPKEIRNVRDVVRQRRSLVRGRTQIKNKISAILNRNGITTPHKHLYPATINWLKDTIDVTDVLQSYFNLHEQYENEIKFVDEAIQNMASNNKQAQLLKTIPGIGSIRAMELIAEIGDINRFSNSSQLCSYAGLVPSIRQSGNSLKFGGLIRQASKTLKCTLIEASWVAVGRKEVNPLKLHYLRLKDKKGKQKAICATARKMLCVVHSMLRKNEEFRY